MAQIERPVVGTRQDPRLVAEFAPAEDGFLTRMVLFDARANELRRLAGECWRSSARTEMLRAAAEWQRAADALRYPPRA
jgi:hypothetical protein